ncbi:adhesin [Brachionus plicatilis]|uniref:Adhesin n=1 Tax=Brachionus plicatilis TaxID=10195 RepID=A0A3M7R1J1_BRAPC|nr:adhesin [Brachionus plicatilis]
MLSPAILLILVHFSLAQFNPGFNQPNQQFNQQQNQQQNQQPVQQANSLSDRTIYQFIKSNPRTTRFGELVDRVSQQAVQSLANVLSSTNQVSGRAGVNSLTVFVPVNEALVQIPSDISMIKNDLENLVVVERLNLDRMRELNNQQIPKTLGYRPRLTLRTVKNFYLFNRDLASTQNTQMNQKRQAVLPLATTYSPQQLSQQQQTNDSSAYDMYASVGNAASNSNSPISTKLPYDEVFFLNYAMVLDMFELSNGLVYLISEYPRFYDKSLLVLFNENDVAGLAQNLNYWIARAAQSFRMGNENLKNALNAYGPNTYFLPTDSAMSKFNDREKLNNDTFLFDQLFKAHRVSNQILFDYYLDDHSPTVMTDTGLPVVTKHYRSGGQEVIEVSIGHVKGRILPNYRNIYCASGVIHLVDTVLGIPGRNAYQEISNIQELSTFKSLVDRSQTYRQMLDQTPSQNLNMANIGKRQIQTANNSSNMFANQAPNQMQQFNADPNFKYMTILAPNNAALIAIKDQLTSNMTAIEQLLSNHIIVDNSANRVFFTDHDQSVFQNGQSYSTMNADFMLNAKVAQDATGTMNRVSLHLSGNEAVRTRIVNGNSRVSNGVVHIVDRVLSLTGVMDITAFLERYSAQNMPNQPAFNQFVKELRDTGIFSELNQPEKKYTLFIPTDEALARYQQVLGSNNAEQKKNLLYRHICMDQNLQSNLIQTSNSQYQDLICRNLLGQDLTLTKDQSGLVSKWMDNSKSKILNDFSGVYSSAYVIEEPLLNDMLPNYGLNNLNGAFGLESSLFVFCFGLVVFFMA